MNRADAPVVVVDDSSDDLALTTILLRKVGDGMRLLTFTEVEATIEFLSNVGAESRDFPRAMVLDVKMPGMTGLDLLEWVREHTLFNSVPVVMWSSSDDPRDLERAARMGAQCYLGKYPPVGSVVEMLAAIDAYDGRVTGPDRFPVTGNLLLERAPLPGKKPS
jgi:CheY-like chemotaxis protein